MATRGRGPAGDVGSPIADRKRRGDYPTPHWLVDETVAGVLPALGDRAAPVRVLDPACGDGRFLAAAARWLRAAGHRVELHGCDIAPAAIEAARGELANQLDPAATTVRLDVADALATTWTGEYDVIVGNPPYLSQLAAATSRGAASARGGGPYADVAAEFVALAAELIAPGGVIGLVLPQSVLASRDVAAIRADVDRRCERIWSWWSPEQVFDAAVVVCVLGLRRPADGAAPAPAQPWTEVITTALGIPPLPSIVADGTLGDRLRVTVEFRDVFYALAAATVDEAAPVAGPALVTTGMIDPWTLGWGRREVTVNKRRFRHPRVALAGLDRAMSEWAAAQLVPKLLVANQSRVVEAVVDVAGELLPGVPVLSLRPRGERPATGDRSATGEPAASAADRSADDADELLWAAAAVLSSPVATIVSWQRQAGTGMSGRAIRLTPAALAAVPWPAGVMAEVVGHARAGEHAAAQRAVLAAYGVAPGLAETLVVWQETWGARGAFRSTGGQNQRS